MDEEDERLVIAVFDGADEDIMYLDLQFLNIKVYRLGTQPFTDYINSFIGRLGTNFFHSWQHKQPGGYKENLYAFCPIDVTKPVSTETFHYLKEILLIMFPSDFQLIGLAYFDKEEDGKYNESFASQWHFISQWRLRESYEPDLLTFNPTDIKKANAFIKLYFQRKEFLTDFEVVIDSYIEAFTQPSAKMAYINYCIALEAIVRAENEITFRISRACAVINSHSKSTGETIFQNTRNFYTLRSKIVHGAQPNFIPEYFFNLRAQVSRTIIEIITFNLPNRKELEKCIDSNGYGQKDVFVENYVHQDFNKPVIELMLQPVPKYKDKK